MRHRHLGHVKQIVIAYCADEAIEVVCFKTRREYVLATDGLYAVNAGAIYCPRLDTRIHRQLLLGSGIVLRPTA